MPQSSEAEILKLTLVSEGAIGLAGFVGLVYWQQLERLSLSVSMIALGLALGLILTFFNFNLERWSKKIPILHAQLNLLQNEILIPLAGKLSLSSICLISVMAGVGEELFFRGLLDQLLGIFLSASLFGLIHFLGSLKRFYLVCVLYILIGLLFSLTVQALMGNLVVVIIAHALLDLLALFKIRKKGLEMQIS